MKSIEQFGNESKLYIFIYFLLFFIVCALGIGGTDSTCVILSERITLKIKQN